MKTLFTLFIFLASFSISAQSISDQVGGVSCSYELYSDGDTLDVIKQLLIQRPTARSGVSDIENQSYGYGYAYSSWCLEFVTNTGISTRNRNNLERRNRRGKYNVTFKNRAGGMLFSQYMGRDKVRLWKGKIHTGVVYTYSLNLIDVPLIVLDNVASIDIVRIE
ncbi:MAG: hypothetical protein P8P74_17230 [Crocinitomicaceae bacterium]|nr:hypothetical protein [Crocinitomicaceae bacterium]